MKIIYAIITTLALFGTATASSMEPRGEVRILIGTQKAVLSLRIPHEISDRSDDLGRLTVTSTGDHKLTLLLYTTVENVTYDKLPNGFLKKYDSEFKFAICDMAEARKLFATYPLTSTVALVLQDNSRQPLGIAIANAKACENHERSFMGKMRDLIF